MSSTALEFGLINTFRTNHVLLDALICMLIPFVIQRLTTSMQSAQTSIWTTLWDLFFGKRDKDRVTRKIEITQRFNQYGKVWDYEQKNHLLQKAISIYLGQVLNLKGKNAQVELVEKPKDPVDKSAAQSNQSDAGSTACSSDDGYDSDDYDYATRTYRGEVDRLSPNALPPVNEYVAVEHGIEFMHEIVTPEGGDGGQSKMTEKKVIFWFRSSLPDGSDRIDTLIAKAFAQYQVAERRKHADDKSRYFYIQSGTKTTDGSTSTTVEYKRYALGEEKTFENLFFQEKEVLLQLLDNFTARRGKFAIKGFPYKLGLLLHGPPGTGKTSLIKAVAQYTKRHIVTISLAKIKTNQELLDAIFDLKFAVDGQDVPLSYSFKDVVFVMEDIDCASSIVNARSGAGAGADSDHEDKLKIQTELLAEQRRATDDDGGASASASACASSAMAGGTDGKLLDNADGLPLLMGPLLKSADKSDRLSLAGLLNVLDGVIDCPGRIVIMTTNHPEKLDPALIRPGRVNKKLLLGYMGELQVRQMLEYYCQATFSAAQGRRLEGIFKEAHAHRHTPAEIEELCAEHDDLDAILAELEGSSGIPAAA